jgi:phosphocarrier protein HPr
MEVTRSFTIQNSLGMAARHSANFVLTVRKGKSEVKVTKEGDDYVANGESILGLLSLACPKGTVITVTADGEDAENVIEALGELIAKGFGVGD